jgi:hypothetical protein
LFIAANKPPVAGRMQPSEIPDGTAAANSPRRRAGLVLNVTLWDFVNIGLFIETTGAKRNRIFAYQPYLNLFKEVAPAQDAGKDAT